MFVMNHLYAWQLHLGNHDSNFVKQSSELRILSDQSCTTSDSQNLDTLALIVNDIKPHLIIKCSSISIAKIFLGMRKLYHELINFVDDGLVCRRKGHYANTCSKTTMSVMLIVAIVAMISLGVSSMASGRSSLNDIHSIAPAANPNPRGKSGSKNDTNKNAGTATIG